MGARLSDAVGAHRRRLSRWHFVRYLARLIAQWLSERLGQQFVVENRPGAGTNVATETVVQASPDGYSLVWVTQTNAINGTLYHSLKFNFIQDIQTVAGVIRVPTVMMVNPSVPAKTVPEFIAYAKANPGKINMSSPGIGNANHVLGELFQMMAGVKLIHVPYRGSQFPDLLSGQVQITFNPLRHPSISYRPASCEPWQ